MKKYLLTLVISCTVLAAFAQDINLTDSVIYFDKKPVAYYVKEVNATDPHYNVYVISLDRKLLVAAQVTEFEAPVKELKPFYYYTLIFTNEKDTFAIYHEGQAFTLELATLLKQYHLLDGVKINKDSLANFKKEYKGNDLLQAKIKEFETYLNENRYFNEQVVRDRTKPVTIVNDKIIMQDGKKIGLLVANLDPNAAVTFAQTKKAEIIPVNSLRFAKDNADVSDYRNVQVFLPSQRMVDASKAFIQQPGDRSRHDNPLYESSLKRNKNYLNEAVLWSICQLVENYLL